LGVTELARGVSASNDPAVVLAANNTNAHGTEILGTVTVINNGIVQLPASPSLPLFAAMGGVEAWSLTSILGASDANRSIVFMPSAVTASLSQQQLDSIVAASIDRWAATGLTQQQVASLRTIKFDVGELDGSYLGEADGNRILIDSDAGGKGWYIGSDALSDSLFNHAVSGTRSYTDPMSAPAGHIDLLTAIAHEMGHKLGLDDSYAEKDRDNLMYGYLTVGERRIPSKGQAASATPSQYAAAHFLSLPPDLIPAGDGFNSRGQNNISAL